MLIHEPQTDLAHSPTLFTLHRVERVLRDAAARGEPPLSHAEIARRLPVKKIRRETVKACVAELARFHMVAEGKAGVMWVFTSSDDVWRRRRVPLR
ncbi:MAG: hypothetical protein HYT80_03440 [Euryarchaeota archaeon]|nr:hypothetical protein [Euryarchaeota archaeon]